MLSWFTLLCANAIFTRGTGWARFYDINLAHFSTYLRLTWKTSHTRLTGWSLFTRNTTFTLLTLFETLDLNLMINEIHLDWVTHYTLLTADTFFTTETWLTRSTVFAGNTIFTLASFSTFGTFLTSWTCFEAIRQSVQLFELKNYTLLDAFKKVINCPSKLMDSLWSSSSRSDSKIYDW